MIRLSVIGCGAVSQQFHLPAIAASPEMKLSFVVDRDLNLAERAASRFRAARFSGDYQDVTDSDAVLIATPHALHAEMCEFFLARGLHVLVEKPLAIRSDDAERLIAIAREKRLVLAVGVFRRYYPVSTFLKHALRGGSMDGLGALESIDAEEGTVYDWALQSRYLLDRAQAGGGVLIDTGSHLLDRLLWWTEAGGFEIDDYRDDSATGVEADCELRARLIVGPQSIPVRAVMSRIRHLRNTIRLQFQRGLIEMGANEPSELRLRIDGWDAVSPLVARLAPPVPPLEFFKQQIIDFAESIQTGREPINTASSNVQTVRLIEACYRERRPFVHEWEAWA